MATKTYNKWSYEKCIELAKECDDYKSFRKFHINGFYFLHRKKLVEKFLNETGWESKTKKKPKTKESKKKKPKSPKWTYEKCIELARKYKSFKDFRENNTPSYQFLRQNKLSKKLQKELGWLKEKKEIDPKLFADASTKANAFFTKESDEIEKLCQSYKYKTINLLPRGSEGRYAKSEKKEGSITNTGFTPDDIYQELLIVAYIGIRDWFIDDYKDKCKSPMFYAAKRVHHRHVQLMRKFFREKDGEHNIINNDPRADMFLNGVFNDQE